MAHKSRKESKNAIFFSFFEVVLCATLRELDVLHVLDERICPCAEAQTDLLRLYTVRTISAQEAETRSQIERQRRTVEE